jgi:SAM-dependent methyltransferase
MESVVYQRMADHEETHWWFRGRRAILERLLYGLRLPQGARILEVGCGTGGNLAMLRKFGMVDALEFDEHARRIAERKGGMPVGYFELPSRLDAPDRSYDLVALLDVLEHVGDDVEALRGVAMKLREGGQVLVTVPAYPFLWSSHDEVHHHYRRYTRATLRKVVADAGLAIDVIGSFNFLLLPAALVQRLGQRLFRWTIADEEIPTPKVNRLLGAIFQFESHVVGRVRLPAGLSIFAIAGTQQNR